jgi:hypothetical protein
MAATTLAGKLPALAQPEGIPQRLSHPFGVHGVNALLAPGCASRPWALESNRFAVVCASAGLVAGTSLDFSASSVLASPTESG